MVQVKVHFCYQLIISNVKTKTSKRGSVEVATGDAMEMMYAMQSKYGQEWAVHQIVKLETRLVYE